METVSISATSVKHLPDYTVLHPEDSHLHRVGAPNNATLWSEAV
jgi:hypothetical protein